MRQALILLIALCTAVPSYAQSVDATLDGIIKDAKGNFEKLTAIDKSDKALKASNDAQIFSTQAANKAEKEVKDATPHCKWMQTAPINYETNFCQWGVPRVVV